MSNLLFSSGLSIGADHVKSKKNCQDALLLIEKKEFVVGFVADGCGDPIESPFSEVGSRFGVTTTVNYIVSQLENTSKWRWSNLLKSQNFWDDVQLNTLEKMDDTARAMGGQYKQTILNHFLFTLIGMVMTPEITIFTGVGDGFYFLNGEKYELRPNPVDNMPPYLAFNLVETNLKKMAPEELHMVVKKHVSTHSVQSAMLVTDGISGLLADQNKNVPGTKEPVGGPEQFWTNPDFFNNTFSLGWRLNQLSSEKRIIDWIEERVNVNSPVLTDDTALIVGSRF